MKRFSKRAIDINKAAGYTIAINVFQILGALTVTALSLATGGYAFTGRFEQILLTGMTIIVCWGAALDIREAHKARRLASEADMLGDAYDKLEELNSTLRAQRHDFMNHLQVVYSLLELEEYPAANEYIEKVYEDVKRVGRSLRTAHPAINALLAAKLSDCESKNIKVELMIESPWEALSVPGWEMCRVLGNLIDNAIDAMTAASAAGKTEMPHLTIFLGETLQTFTFEISNNGPRIPENIIERIFQNGFSTKSMGRGMGLSIVKGIMQTYNGSIELHSDDERTTFTGVIRKPAARAMQEESSAQADAAEPEENKEDEINRPTADWR